MSALLSRPGGRASAAAIAAIVLAYLGLELFVFDVAFIFHGDHERDLRHVWVLVTHGDWPQSTPSISPLPFELGPLLYLIMAPMVRLSADPFWVRVWFVALAAAGLVMVYALLRGRVRWEAAAFACFGLASSTFAYELSRQLWHSSLLVLPTAGFLFATTRMLEDEAGSARWGMLAAGCAAVSVQLHMTASGFTLVLLGAAIVQRRALGRAGWARGLGVYLVCLLPFLITLAGSLSGGALDRLNTSGGRPWSPANPLGFFVANVHTIWGDNLGPLLTWPWVALMGVGAWRAVREKAPLGRLLLAVVLVGFVVEAALLGNQRAHRYMHANVIAAFGLGALGLELVIQRIERIRWALAGLFLVIAVEAVVSDVPHAGGRGWMSAYEQRAVTELMAANFPLNDEVVEARVHGVFFGESMGMGHLRAISPPGAGQIPDALHVMVMPTDLALLPHGKPAGKAYTVKSRGRDVQVYAYEPLLDYSRQTFEPAGLAERWRKPRRGPDNKPAQITIPVRWMGTVHAAWSEGHGRPCALSADLDGTRLDVVFVEARAYRGMRFAKLRVINTGTLRVTLSGCAPTFFDVF